MYINPHNIPRFPCVALCENNTSELQQVHMSEILILLGITPELTIL